MDGKRISTCCDVSSGRGIRRRSRRWSAVIWSWFMPLRCGRPKTKAPLRRFRKMFLRRWRAKPGSSLPTIRCRHGFTERLCSKPKGGCAGNSTAVSVSATTAALVVNGALQSAPPMLAGLTGLLASLASWSKVEVAVLCLAVAALPVGWRWNERRAAQQEAARMQADLEAARLEQTTLATEIQRLTE